MALRGRIAAFQRSAPGVVACAALVLGGSACPGEPPPSQPEPEFEDQLLIACTQCHLWSPPEVLPKRAWRGRLSKMFKLANVELLARENKPILDLQLEDAVSWFEERAPAELDAPPFAAAAGGSGLVLEHRVVPALEAAGGRPGLANVRSFELFEDSPGEELVTCDMLAGWVSWVDPVETNPRPRAIKRLSHPGHAEPADLDGDGRTDLLVAELGAPRPTDERVGAVSWLRRSGAREFEASRLVTGLGRVADARAGDFDGDGDQDVLVAVFGWIQTGRLLLLQNRGAGAEPRFLPQELDSRSGAIHIPLVDLDDDGDLDAVALLSQESERVLLLRGDGEGSFETETLWRAPHPHWGFSGLDLADMDRDGDLDLVVTNGDTLDDDVQFKPYQGVAWIEQRAEGQFLQHRIGIYYGAHRAEAGDMDLDGDLDVVATSFLPGLEQRDRVLPGPPGVVFYEQRDPGQFVAHVLAQAQCDKPTLELADLDADGKLDVVTGSWNLSPGGRDDGSGRVDLWLQAQR